MGISVNQQVNINVTNNKLCSFPGYSLQCGRFNLELNAPIVMGILNVTPDSFSEVGRIQDIEQAVQYGVKMVEEGARIIDIGGEPTNPSLHPVTLVEEELRRVVPVVERLRKRVNVPISVDTSKKEVIKAVIDVGADIINDVRALSMPGAVEALAKQSVGICLMHMSYPHGMPKEASPPCDSNKNILTVVKSYLQERVAFCMNAGIELNRIIIDPGIGAGNFGKDLAQNLILMNHIESFLEFNLPILIGASRKTFIGQQLNLPVQERLNGSLAAAVIAVSKGASIIRAHDVKATVEAIAMTTAILQAR